MKDTYRIYVWVVDEDWEVFATGLSKWELRTVLRGLYHQGYTQCSVLVKAETHERSAARWDRGFMASDKPPKSVRRKLMQGTHA